MRVREVHVTEKGREAFREFWPDMHAAFAKMFAGISEAEYETLIRLLTRVLRNIRRNETRFVTSLDQSPTAQPIMTPANRYRTTNNLGSLAYMKPSIVLLALRNKVLGAEVFDTAFREYTRRWVFKHPQPAEAAAAGSPA